MSIIQLTSVLAASDLRLPVRSVRDFIDYRLNVPPHALGRVIDPAERPSAEFRISYKGCEYYSMHSGKKRVMPPPDMLNNFNIQEMKNPNLSVSKLTTFAKERAETLEKKLQPAEARPARNAITQAR